MQRPINCNSPSASPVVRGSAVAAVAAAVVAALAAAGVLLVDAVVLAMGDAPDTGPLGRRAGDGRPGGDVAVAEEEDTSPRVAVVVAGDGDRAAVGGVGVPHDSNASGGVNGAAVVADNTDGVGGGAAVVVAVAAAGGWCSAAGPSGGNRGDGWVPWRATHRVGCFRRW